MGGDIFKAFITFVADLLCFVKIIVDSVDVTSINVNFTHLRIIIFISDRVLVK